MMACVGAYLFRSFGSKHLANLCEALGVSCSYSEAIVLEISSIVRADTSPEIEDGAFILFVFDKSDVNVNTLDSKIQINPAYNTIMHADTDTPLHWNPAQCEKMLVCLQYVLLIYKVLSSWPVKYWLQHQTSCGYLEIGLTPETYLVEAVVWSCRQAIWVTKLLYWQRL